MKKKQLVFDVIVITVAAVISALGLHVFISPAGFAPIGVDGIATMLQSAFGINMGITLLIFNVPLLLIAWFVLSKKYVIYTLLFTFLSSGMLIVLEEVSFYQYQTETNLWLSVIVAGFLLGLRSGLTLKYGGSTGGIEIVANLVQKRYPYFNVENLVSAIAFVIMLCSLLVYPHFESILMTVVQMVIYNFTVSQVLKPTRNALEVKIITDHPQELREDLLSILRHGATVVTGKGLYTDTERSLVITVINVGQLGDLLHLTQKYPNTFTYYMPVSGVMGNFRWKKHDPVK